ncbi:hypothetical protein Tco_0284600, partial [Tanacetum coccineum]
TFSIPISLRIRTSKSFRTPSTEMSTRDLLPPRLSIQSFVRNFSDDGRDERLQFSISKTLASFKLSQNLAGMIDKF